MKPTLVIILCFSFFGCAMVEKRNVMELPDIRTRTLFADFDKGTVAISWCLPSREPGKEKDCQLCGEFSLPSENFKAMTEADLTAAIVSSIKHAEIRSGAACQRKE